jgi:hypothetical protein
MPSPRHEHNDSFRLHRAKPDGVVAVLNQDGFVMAEYNPVTGATAWLRVVPAAKRDSVERKLSEQFPIAAAREPRPDRARRRR